MLFVADEIFHILNYLERIAGSDKGFLHSDTEIARKKYPRLFRGNTLHPDTHFNLPAGLPENRARIAGEGSISAQGQELRFSIPEPRRFLFARGHGRTRC